MKCPICPDNKLVDRVLKNGIRIDQCDRCKGIWLNEGDLGNILSSSNRITYENFLINGPDEKKLIKLTCPHCLHNQMEHGFYPRTKVKIEHCPKCRGQWYDPCELEKIAESVQVRKLEKLGRMNKRFQINSSSRKLIELPSLGISSVIVMGSLYSILLGLLVFFRELEIIPSNGFVIGFLLVFIFLQFILGPWFMDLNLRILGQLSWVTLSDLPEDAGNFIKHVCLKENLKIPRLGIINDDAPNAFTYGRFQNDARLVITKGLLKALNKEELKCVLAHEIGHIVHWDFLFMTMAKIVPLILYQIYNSFYKLKRSSMRSSTKSKNSSQGAIIVAMIIAYLAYVISDYIVLYLSRIREYWADRYSGTITRNPNGLSSALIKISYGLAYNVSSQHEDMVKNNKGNSIHYRQNSMDSFGIANYESSKLISLYKANEGTDNINQIALHAMKWDFWNPWAKWYELNSTHPLTAKRINALSNQAISYEQRPAYLFDLKQPESYMDEFLIDLFFSYCPFVFICIPFLKYIGPLNPIFDWGGNIIYQHLFWFFVGLYTSFLFRYQKGTFLPSTVSSLLKIVKVSRIRPVRTRLRGTIIGRGIPGMIISEDLVLQDHTGKIFLDYEQPLGFFNLLFSLFRAKSYIGEEVIIEGWYRRGPMPYVEVHKILTKDKSSICYTYAVGNFVLPVITLILLSFSFGVISF